MIRGIDYQNNLLNEMSLKWPDNRIVNIVCHGHSVPAGYFATPYVNTFDSYPHLLHRIIKERFPYAAVNVIVTAIGGETSVSGAERFERDVLNHSPDTITIDYALNDRGVGLEAAKESWEYMINAALKRNINVILLTPTWDNSFFTKDENWQNLVKHKNQIIELADKYNVGLADSFKCYENYVRTDTELVDLLSHVNHPSKKGHELVAYEIAKYFLAR